MKKSPLDNFVTFKAFGMKVNAEGRFAISVVAIVIVFALVAVLGARAYGLI